MGGERCGGRAAEIATATVRQCFDVFNCADFPAADQAAKAKDVMLAAIQEANRRVHDESVAMSECAGMGSTLSALAVCSDCIVVGHVGDTRAYLYRDGELSQLTRDDSVVATLIAAGEITESEARSHPMRNRLTQSVGFRETVAVQLLEAKLQRGDRLLLSSDGLHGLISNTEIAAMLAMGEPAAETADSLVRAARDQGAPDNTSIIVVDYV
jgi:protein phosphatase